MSSNGGTRTLPAPTSSTADTKRFLARRRHKAPPPRGAQTVPSSPTLQGTLSPTLTTTGEQGKQQQQPARKRSGASNVSRQIGKVFGGVRRSNTLPESIEAGPAPAEGGSADAGEKAAGATTNPEAGERDKPSETRPDEKKGAPDKEGEDDNDGGQ
ncbi:hypothetical protein BN946_scf185042.g154 [Trametes cinnabarina]|uniref:Uncharacterized protein n=1 Tax=Pycnoporus cinnabarinus TaxID=5643 RepID=A0A060S4A7_PYCCI|nr:hypothetical protein BN946_scf185042.g154 [Trametes cinnabarina]